MAERDEIQSTGDEDTAVEATVLRQLIALHSAQVTLAELVRALAADPDEFSERDAIERAVGELGRAGLAHRNGELVLPSRAALRLSELFESG